MKKKTLMGMEQTLERSEMHRICYSDNLKGRYKNGDEETTLK
jgi:hypothetical protein